MGLYKKTCLKTWVLFCAVWAMPAMLWASEITQVTLLDSDDGDVVRIAGDAPLEYQVFDLDGPPRLLLSFPSASLAKSVQGSKASGDGVLAVNPVVANHGIRLEMRLSRMLKYRIEEKNHQILIHFAGTKKVHTQASHASVVKDVTVRDQGGVTELHILGDMMDSNHTVFASSDGTRLIVDFWGATSKLKKEFYQFSSQHIRKVTVGESNNRVRFVVGLTGGSDMQRQVDANSHELVVRLGRVAPRKNKHLVSVEDVEFRPEDRVAHIMIRTSQTNPIVDIQEKDGKIIVHVHKATLLAGQERTQDVREFPGPVTQIDSYQDGRSDVNIVARLREKVRMTSFQQGNVFTINLEPEDVALARMKQHGNVDPAFAYKGQKVTFDFKDIDIRNALKLIAEMSDLNIIMSDDVSGVLTMHLVDVPWDQALDLILSAKGLGQEKVGNVMRIAPMEVLRSEYATRLETRKGSLQLEPLVTEFITPSYAKVSDIKTILDSSKGKASKGDKTGGGSSGLMTARGSVLLDDRTNTLILKDTRQAINAVKSLIAKIDRPIKQVQIEARIVEASDLFQRNLGIRWGGRGVKNTAKNFPNTVAVGGTQLTAGTTGGNGMVVDLPAAVIGNGTAVTGVGLALGSLNKLINLNLELSAAEVDGDVHIVSNPRIVTTNLKPATIKQGTQLAFVTPGTANAPATTTFKDALLELTVTPQITADNSVLLEVLVKKDAPSTTGNGIDKKEITTNVLVKNGGTVVIGGIYTRVKQKTTNGVPWLSKIPFLGWLFKNDSKKDNKTELLIFLTPKILSGGENK